jgi:hypothetical protein
MYANIGAVIDTNGITLALIVIVAVSLLQGLWRGASGSAKQLFIFVLSSVVSVGAIAVSAWAASYASPHIQRWLLIHGMARPSAKASSISQFFYTVVSGLRDFPLFRFAVVFLASYFVLRLATGGIVRLMAGIGSVPLSLFPSGGPVSRVFGGILGTALGAGRALLFTALLFGYSALFPNGPVSAYIQHSGLYREVASQVIKPAAGQLLEEKLPVFAQAMTSELDQLWQRRYDVIDADLPGDIVAAAKSVTADTTDDERKAKELYNWVGSRIVYDNDKVTAYEQKGEWHEQNPEMTFATRKGVCIDYARLYAAMARAVGLDARVVTGLGYDGQGGFGPHAWNEVYLPKRKAWVPLDPTWARSGEWFDPPRFDVTHIRQA